MLSPKFFSGLIYTQLVIILMCTNCTTKEKQTRAEIENEWISLWNGKDFSGWIKFLAKPHPDTDFPGMERGADGKYTRRVGLNNDPLQVFSVVEEDGKPAIRISGVVFGTISTVEAFDNYHLKLQFKWGEDRHPPRQSALRDSGLLFHCFGGPDGLPGSPWPHSQEFQIQETDLGDFWAIGNVKMDAPCLKMENSDLYKYDPAGEMRTFFHRHQPQQWSDRRIVKNVDNEKNHGEWNELELICSGDSSIFVVNGTVVNRLYNSKRQSESGDISLVRGNISLQSEGAELFFRNIYLRKISAVPEEYRSS